MAPRAVLMKTGLKSFNTARPVNTVRSVNTGRPFSTARSFNTVRPFYTAHPKSTTHCARPRTYFQNQAQSTVHRPFYKRTALTKRCFNQRFNTGRPFRSTVNTVRARGFNVVKPSACWVWRPIKPNGASLSNSQLNDKGFVDSGCSRHMTGNIAHLSDFKDFDGGYVTFGGGAYGGRITGKVVTDDYSRFSWVFFLTTKDETSEILKNFIKEVENLVDKKVKIIRSDNGTEFKNKVMDDFCREKGIKREYSVARTPQQNGVAERKNRTLIEAARTMLADSKLPTTFWAEAVSTTCYVQNRVLIVKPHNKTPYELFRVSESSTSSQQDQVNQDCIIMPIWKDASYFGDAAPRSVVDAQIQDKDGLQDENDATEKSHDDSSLKENGTAVQQVDTARPEINTGSRQVSTDVPEVNTATPEDLYLPLLTQEFTKITTLEHVIVEEPKKVSNDLSDLAWVEEMQEELLQFKLQKVWILVDLPKGHRAISTKALTMMKSFARKRRYRRRDLWLELKQSEKFLAYAPTWEFMVYQMDVKRASCSGQIEEEYYVQQKKKGIFISQDKYVNEILRKNNYTDVKSASTLTDLEKPLVHDGDAVDVDEHLYRSMIGSLMCLTSSRPDIIYLKGKPSLGLWYSKDSPLELVAYTDSDYAGATQDMKLTTGGYMQKKQLKTHSSTYPVPSLNTKVFSNMRRLTKGYTGVEIRLFPTMLTLPTPASSPTPSSSPSRITSSPSLSSEPSTVPTFEPQPSPDAEYHVPTPNESPLHAVHSHGMGGGIEVLEDDLKRRKQTYSSAFTKLILRIKKLESKVKTGKARKRARIILLEDEEDDSSK
ncbi:retrovirus-related pol polyprotein from transposon TNT 1-94 [Tanacetum coccineum]